MSEENGKSAVGTAIAVIVLIAVSAAGGWIARELTPEKKEAAENPLAAMLAMPVTVAVTNVETRVYNLPERYVAHAEAVQEVDLLPQVDGYIREIKFKEGDVS